MSDYFLMLVGLAALITGGELLVRGSSVAAGRMGMSPLLIGITLVGFGTSMPELVISVEASLLGSPGIAIGNIVGSNIANMLLILGAAALVTPIAVSRIVLARDGVIVFLSTVLFIAIGCTGALDRLVGSIFMLILCCYLIFAYRQEKAGAADHSAAFEKGEAHDELGGAHSSPMSVRSGPILTPLLLALGGLLIVIFGGKLIVEGATGIARAAGISETVIGLTIVSVGTSLPELTTSIIAALRRHTDVALGNVLGSNIYNILGIGGATGIIAPTPVPPQIVAFDNPIMLAVTIVLLLLTWSLGAITRIGGILLLAGYAVYLLAIWP